MTSCIFISNLHTYRSPLPADRQIHLHRSQSRRSILLAYWSILTTEEPRKRNGT